MVDPARPAIPLLPPACGVCEVRQKALFSVLGASELMDAAGVVTSAAFEPGQVVYLQGTTAGAAFTVRSGIVRFERVTASGHRRIVRLAGQGALIGQESVLQRPYADDAVACTRVEVCRIPRAMVDEFTHRQPVLGRELMQRWQHALEAAEEWTAEMASGTARRRVLKLLQQLQQYSPDGESIWLPSRAEMSDMLGLAVETTSRIVSKLRREGVLDAPRPGKARVDPPRLQQALRSEDV